MTDQPRFELAPADTVAPEELHASFAAAFSDYLAGPYTRPFEDWSVLVARQCIALPASRVALQEGRPVAFAFVSLRPQGRRWRLAGMGAAPPARGTGAAPALLDDFIARAARAGQTAVELECFAANERALRLYRRRGFRPRQELAGYTLADGATVPAPLGGRPREVDRETACAWLDSAQRCLRELPLQLTRPVLSQLTRPVRCWQRGSAQLAWSDTGEGPIQVHSLLDASEAQADAQALVAAMCATRPGAAVDVPAVQRADLCGRALERLGFERQPLHQWLMVRALA